MPETTPYDTIPYPGHAYRQTHPDRLAALASLLGMDPAPADRCRVLEFGCGTGSNLIPLAATLPESEFLGIDLAMRPIEQGHSLIQQLGLTNIKLSALDLMEFPASMGKFDYIIAHGLYSWVPRPVQDRIMELCRSHLTDQGVAFVSYNTYPGGHLRNMVREMLLFHVHNAPDPQTKIRQGHALLQFLVEGQSEESGYGQLLQKELQRVMHYPVGHFYHDDLAEINESLYFHQFIDRAQNAGLQFLSEAEYFMVRTDQFPEPTARLLDSLSENILLQQQYLDFLRCRRFRQTLLCHGERSVCHQIDGQRMTGFAFSSPCRMTEDTGESSIGEEGVFLGEQNASLVTTSPLAKAALSLLGRAWPQAVHFNDLLNQVLHCLGRQENSGDKAELSRLLQKGFGSGMVELHQKIPQLVLKPGPRPLASPLARMQAADGETITTLRHRTIRLADLPARRLLQLLDGTRPLEELTTSLNRASVGDQPLFEVQQVHAMLAELGRLGLLLA